MDFNDGEVADLLGRLSDAKSPSGFEDEVVDVVRDFCSGWAKVESNTVHDALITPNNFTATSLFSCSTLTAMRSGAWSSPSAPTAQ